MRQKQRIGANTPCFECFAGALDKNRSAVH